LFWKKKPGKSPSLPGDLKVTPFQKRLRYQFLNPDLLLLALSHRSWVFQKGQDRIHSNERLEFLGDSVLGLLINEGLFLSNPGLPEGDLTKRKSLLVSGDILMDIGANLGIDEVILISSNERGNSREIQGSIIADAVEAVIGAVYLDGGLEAARPLVQRLILDKQEHYLESDQHRNHKSILQEIVQSRFNAPPRYRIDSTSGPEHSKVFHVQVIVAGEVLANGEGRSKKDAEKEAARLALELLEKRKSTE
jgi:ribonuclease-3